MECISRYSYLGAFLCQGTQEATKESAGRTNADAPVCVSVSFLVGQRTRKYVLTSLHSSKWRCGEKKKFAVKRKWKEKNKKR